MAFYDDNTEDEDQKAAGGPVAASAQSSVVGGGADGSANGLSTAEPAGSGAAPKPEAFVGISQYINANKPQSQKLANQVAGNIDQKAAGVDSALNSANNSFNQAADSQKVNANADLLNQVSGDASKVAADQSKATEFAKLRDASYTGPQKLEDIDSGNAWGGIQAALQKARAAKAAAGTEEGRMGLIKEVSNNPRQSQGALTFDNLLLQSNPNSAAQLQAAGSSLGDIDQRLASSNAAAQAKAQSIAANNSQQAAAARDALSGGYSGIASSLADREKAADAKQKQAVNDLKAGLKAGNLTADQAKDLGIKLGSSNYGINPYKYVNYADSIDKNSVATADDLSRQQALKQLAGNIDLGDDILNPTATLGQQGSGFNFDKSGYLNKIDKTKAGYQDAMTNQPFDAMKLGLPANAGSLDQTIKTYEKDLQQLKDWNVSAGQKAGSIAEYEGYLNNILYPAAEKLKKQFNVNSTLQPIDTNRDIPGYLSRPVMIGK